MCGFLHRRPPLGYPRFGLPHPGEISGDANATLIVLTADELLTAKQVTEKKRVKKKCLKSPAGKVV